MAQHVRWTRFADGADEVHQWRIAQRTIDAYKKDKSIRHGTHYRAAGEDGARLAVLLGFARALSCGHL